MFGSQRINRARDKADAEFNASQARRADDRRIAGNTEGRNDAFLAGIIHGALVIKESDKGKDWDAYPSSPKDKPR